MDSAIRLATVEDLRSLADLHRQLPDFRVSSCVDLRGQPFPTSCVLQVHENSSEAHKPEPTEHLNLVNRVLHSPDRHHPWEWAADFVHMEGTMYWPASPLPDVPFAVNRPSE